MFVVALTAAEAVEVPPMPCGMTSLLPSFSVPEDTVSVPLFQSEPVPVPEPPSVRLPVPE